MRVFVAFRLTLDVLGRYVGCGLNEANPSADTLRGDKARDLKRGGGSRERQANLRVSKTLRSSVTGSSTTSLRSSREEDSGKPETITRRGKSLQRMKPRGASSDRTG